MKYITVLNVLAKVIFTLFIFILVRNTADYLYVPLISSAGYVIAGLIALWIVMKKYRISIVRPKYSNIICHIRSGWHIFTSRIFVNLYTSTNIFLLGFLTNNVVVGYYTIADKLISALTGLASPFNQAVYPYLAKLHATSQSEYLTLTKKFLVMLLTPLVVAAILTLFFSAEIIKLASGQYIRDSIITLRILAVTVIFLPLGGYFTQLLIIQNKTQMLSRIVLIAALINILLAVPLIYLFNATGLAIAVVLVQILVNLMIIMFMYKSNEISYSVEKSNV
jgi:PST family polysaccharide transporter